MIFSRIAAVLTILLLLSTPVFAQDARSIELPNAMSIHTWFIIGAVGAFLAWCISYAFQQQKEANQRREDRGGLKKQKEELLDEIADLETRKEAGQIAEQRYKHELKELRFHLTKTLEKMAKPEAQKSAKKTS